MKKFNYQIIAALFCLITNVATLKAQNIGINSTGTAPNTSAILDIDASTPSGKRGLLIPRVTSAERTAMSPLPAAAQGLVVYQTDAPEGFYYNTSTTTTPNWSYLSQGWSLTGNAGTSPGTNYIGTTDVQSLMFKVNNQKSGIVEGTTGNTSLGYQSLFSNTTGTNNSVIGSLAMHGNLAGCKLKMQHFQFINCLTFKS